MFKFFRGRGSNLSGDRLKQQKDLFAFNKTSNHGFPYQPTCMAYDNVLNLLAIGTRNGYIHLVGRPGVEINGKHDNDAEIKNIYFLEGRGQLITLTEDYTLHLWEINSKQTDNKDNVDQVLTNENKEQYSYLEKVKENINFNKDKRESNLKDITTLTVCCENNSLFIGTSSGNVYIIDLRTFEQTDQVIYQDVVIQNMTTVINNDEQTEQNKHVNPGPVEVIQVQPNDLNKILIGYQKGLIVLWNNVNLITERTFSINQQLESLCWLNNGEKFVSSHNDGSHIIWQVGTELRLPVESQKTIYGPFSCKPINKIVWKTIKNDEDLMVFTGGMPRAAHGDKNTVSIIQGSPETGKHHVIELTSKVVDFIVIDEKDEQFDNSKALIILADKEMIAIDLRDPDWLQFRLPYFCCVDLSVITFSDYYRNVSDDLINKFINAENEKTGVKYSSREWPIIGGQLNSIDEQSDQLKDILITGHEDGGLRFWLTGNTKLQHLYTLNTSKLFISMDGDIAPIDGDDIPADEADGSESEWPPFRKVGVFDPCTDDVRLAIRKVLFSIKDGHLIVGGTSGQIILFELKDEKTEKPLSVVSTNIIEESEGFVWKGLNKLTPINGLIKFDIGYQPKTIMQLYPPAALTALTECSNWSLLAAGTSHGFVLYDNNQNKVVFTKSTMKIIEQENPSEETGNASITRSKSFRKSLRESFRRLRKRRTQSADKSDPSTSPSSSPSKDSGTKSPIKSDIEKAGTLDRTLTMRPVEQSLPSGIRCLHFSKTSINNTNEETSSLWIGTNSGLVSVYALTIPSDEKRGEEELKTELAKEFALKHKAPVIFIQIVDNNGKPVNVDEESVVQVSKSGEEPMETEKPETEKTVAVTEKSTLNVSHKALICSEEQFKLFNLPTFKPFCKSKVSVHNVSKVIKINLSTFVSKSDKEHIEYCLTALINDGNVIVLKLNELTKQIQTKLLDNKDSMALYSLCFINNGNGLYLSSSSEYQYFTLSANTEKSLHTYIDVPEGVRPVIEIVKQANEEKIDEETKDKENEPTAEISSKPVDEEKVEEKSFAEVVAGDKVVDDDKENEKKDETITEKPEKEKEKSEKKEEKSEKKEEKLEKKAEKEKKDEKKTESKKNEKNNKKNKKGRKDSKKSQDKDDKEKIKDDEKVKDDGKENSKDDEKEKEKINNEKNEDDLKKDDKDEKTEKQTINGINNKNEINEKTETSVTVTQTFTEKFTESNEQKTSTPIKSIKTTTKSTVINGSNDKTNGVLETSMLSEIDTQDMSIESVKDYMNNLSINETSDLKTDVVKDVTTTTTTPIINTNED